MWFKFLELARTILSKFGKRDFLDRPLKSRLLVSSNAIHK